MAQTLGCRPDIRRVSRKKRLVAESAIEALRAWNDANEIEGCPREHSYVEMYPHLGDADKLEEIRTRNKNCNHCPWLRTDANACMALPSSIKGAEDKAGLPCPHNVYYHQHQVFSNREGVADTIERIFRLLNAAELHLLSESALDPLSVTELMTARSELDRQHREKSERERQRTSLEAQANQQRKTFG